MTTRGINRGALALVAGCLWLGGMALAAEAPSVAEQLQDCFSQAANKAFPAVVVITSKQVDRRVGMYRQMPPELRYFFGFPDEGDTPDAPEAPRGRRQPRQVPQPVGKGSGVIIRADGYVLTNCHVVKDSDALEVKLQDGTVFDNSRDKEAVQVVGTDEDTDLAVLRLKGDKAKDLPVLRFADSDQVKIGEWAIAVGAPFNLDYSVTVGVVSQKGRYDVNMNTYENYIQTDASINPGNSGGPLLNLRGEVIGINDFIFTGGMSRGSIGLGFAIASNLARQVGDSLIETGTVSRPWLGIAMQSLTDDLRKQFGVEDGVLVSEVLKGDPAETAGVEAGDVILKVNGKDVRTPHDVQFAVLAAKPGDKLKLAITRRGKSMDIEVVARLKDTKDGGVASVGDKDDLLNQVGLALEDTEEGVVVSGVVAGSPAQAADIWRGDRILEVNRQPVKTAKDVLSALAVDSDEVAVLYIDRRGSKFFRSVALAGEKK